MKDVKSKERKDNGSVEWLKAVCFFDCEAELANYCCMVMFFIQSSNRDHLVICVHFTEECLVNRAQFITGVAERLKVKVRAVPMLEAH